MVGTDSSGGSVHLTHMLIAVTAMFLQQTCGSIARALPAVLAPLIIAELHANAAWVGIYFSLTAFAGLIGQLGSGGFIIRHGAIRMSQIALLFTGAGLAVAVLGGAVGFVLSALIGNGVASVATPASSQLLGRWSVMRYAPFAFSIAQCAIPAGILLTGYLASSLGRSAQTSAGTGGRAGCSRPRWSITMTVSRCRWMCGSPLSRMPQQSKLTGKPCLAAAAKARFKPGWSASIGRPSRIRMRMPRAPGVAAHFATTSSTAGLVASTGVTTRNLSG